MNANIPKTKQKIADITPPSKAARAALPQIVIEKRAHLERTEGPGADRASSAPPVSVSTSAASSVPATTTSPTPAPQVQTPVVPKRPVITPPEDTDTSKTTPEDPKDSRVETLAVPPSAPTSEPADTDTDEASDTTGTAGQAVDETKVAKEAEAAARREGELEKFIDTKQFFVPINKEAQKRSIKVTLWLTALYIFLSLVLINLMLDTGMILLLQKLPHTNFFSV